MRGKQFNLTEGTEGSILINATATALDPTANIHCWYDLTWEQVCIFMANHETEACTLNISPPPQKNKQKKTKTGTGTKDIKRTGLMGQKPKSGKHELTICLPATVNTLHSE